MSNKRIKEMIEIKSEEFISFVKKEYEFSLSVSKEGLPLFEDVIDKVKNYSDSKREEAEIGLTAFLTEVLLECYEGELIDSEYGYCVRLYNTLMVDEIDVFPEAWIKKRMQNGKGDSISFKINSLYATVKVVKYSGKFAFDLKEDKEYAKILSKRLKVSSIDEMRINEEISKLLDISINIIDEMLVSISKTVEFENKNEPAYKYFVSRIFKIYYFNAENFMKYFGEKFSDSFKSLSINKVIFSGFDFFALLDYVSNVPFGPNSEFFDELFDIEKNSKIFKFASFKERNEIIIQLLKINGRKLYHHDIKEFKKILKMVEIDNMEAIDFLLNYRVGYRQGCYKAIEFLFAHDYKEKDIFKRFDRIKNIIFWLDNANGREPKKPWIDKLLKLEQMSLSEDLNVICKWILSNNELKYDEENWVDSVFTRFQKSSKFYLESRA